MQISGNHISSICDWNGTGVENTGVDRCKFTNDRRKVLVKIISGEIKIMTRIVLVHIPSTIDNL